MKTLLIHRLDNLNDPQTEALLNHYVKHLTAAGLDVTTVLNHITTKQLADGQTTEWLRASLRALSEVDVLACVDTIGPDRGREVLRMAAEACGHSMVAAEKYCPPFYVNPTLDEA